ncbi:MAG: signal peptidase II [Candidatus Actinomarinales bacterium]|nr:signal peptidase II [Candidatus Actinomarinales bacterium]
MKLKKFLRPYFYASVIAALDLYIKHLIRANNIQESVIIDNFLTIDLTYNTGIAFGLFSEYTLVTYFFSVIVFSWLIFQFRNVKQNTLEFYSLILILGGAIGNLGERGWNLIFNNNGKVTDFVELLFIPSFNLADTYITFGICFLLFSEIKNK